MRFKVEGVSADTGKKVAPQEFVADDQREAATMAKSLNILPTRITPITDLLTINTSQADSDESIKPRRTTLISIDGHPRWFVATLVLGLLITSVWIFGGNRNAKTQSTGESFYDTSEEFHITVLKSMGDLMYMDEYEDSRGFTLPYDQYWGYIVGGVAHIHAPSRDPYEMQWRLQSGFPGIDVPVSFLDVTRESHFSHEMAVEAVKEFDRIAGGVLSIEDVREAMQEAEALMLSIQNREPEPIMGSWSVESSVPKTVTITEPVGSYLVKVSIREWPVEAYLLESGACEVFIFFAYCPPGVTGVENIHSSGF